MKKIIVIALLFAACKSSNNGQYINHTKNEYVIADDTLEVRDSILIEHTGYQRIRNGIVQPKEFKTKQLFELHPQFKGNEMILNNTTYEKL